MPVDNTALLIIDMLNDFVLEGAPLGVPDARNIIQNIKARIRDAYGKNSSVIYLCDSHSVDDPEFNLYPSHAVKGTKGASVIDELKPQKRDIVIPKTTFSGFMGTDLEEKLRELSVSRLITTGILTNICVLYTTADAVMRGYRVTVPRNCVAALTKKDHEFALEQMQKYLKVKII